MKGGAVNYIEDRNDDDASQWTAELVRAQLPTIIVKMRATGEHLTGVITGRKLEFARVVVWLPHYKVWMSEEYSWDVLAQVLNENLILEWGDA